MESVALVFTRRPEGACDYCACFTEKCSPNDLYIESFDETECFLDQLHIFMRNKFADRCLSLLT